MPILNKQYTLEVTVEQFLNACSDIELQEIELLLPTKLNLRKRKRPPIGVVPKFIKDEERFNELSQAIARYIHADEEVPDKWMHEYMNLKKQIKNE